MREIAGNSPLRSSYKSHVKLFCANFWIKSVAYTATLENTVVVTTSLFFLSLQEIFRLARWNLVRHGEKYIATSIIGRPADYVVYRRTR